MLSRQGPLDICVLDVEKHIESIGLNGIFDVFMFQGCHVWGHKMSACTMLHSLESGAAEHAHARY